MNNSSQVKLPYPYNTQRYAVYCYRDDDKGADADKVENIATQPQTEASEEKTNSSVSFIRFESALYIIIPVLLVILALVLFLPLRRKNQKD